MLTARQDKLLRQLQTRQGRRKSPYFLCEGLRCAQEALTRRPNWLELALLSEDFHDLDLGALIPPPAACRVPARTFAEYAETENPQGILLVLRRPDAGDLPSNAGATLVLDRLADPGNLGTILRTAWAVGMQSVLLTQGTCDPFAGKVVRAGMGAHFALNLVRIDTLNDLPHRWPDRPVWLADAKGASSCFDDTFDLRRAFLVLGNEAGGPAALPGAQTVHIPMPGNAESLNVAQAATVLLFEALRRKVI